MNSLLNGFWIILHIAKLHFMQNTHQQIFAQQESSKAEKKTWVTPEVEQFSKSGIQSGALALVEGLNVLGNLTS
jgi:hypothetical protein